MVGRQKRCWSDRLSRTHHHLSVWAVRSWIGHSVQAAGSACCERPEVVASCWCYYIEGGRATALSQAAEKFGRRAGWLAVFLWHCDPASPGVCLPGVAHKSHCCADEGIRVAAAQSSMYHLWRRWLYVIANQSWVQHAGGTARTTHQALLQMQCSPRDVVLALSAPVWARRLCH